MFTNLAFHSKPAQDDAVPDDKKTRALKDAMTNWQVDTMSDLLPSSVRPLVKKTSVGDVAARPAIDDIDAPVFAHPRDWSMQLVQKLQYLSKMTPGEMAWAHQVYVYVT